VAALDCPQAPDTQASATMTNNNDDLTFKTRQSSKF
jgi:hypothetical protein